MVVGGGWEVAPASLERGLLSLHLPACSKRWRSDGSPVEVRRGAWSLAAGRAFGSRGPPAALRLERRVEVAQPAARAGHSAAAAAGGVEGAITMTVVGRSATGHVETWLVRPLGGGEGAAAGGGGGGGRGAEGLASALVRTGEHVVAAVLAR